jgi:hypothetical protein
MFQKMQLNRFGTLKPGFPTDLQNPPVAKFNQEQFSLGDCRIVTGRESNVEGRGLGERSASCPNSQHIRTVQPLRIEDNPHSEKSFPPAPAGIRHGARVSPPAAREIRAGCPDFQGSYRCHPLRLWTAALRKIVVASSLRLDSLRKAPIRRTAPTLHLPSAVRRGIFRLGWSSRFSVSAAPTS